MLIDPLLETLTKAWNDQDVDTIFCVSQQSSNVI